MAIVGRYDYNIGEGLKQTKCAVFIHDDCFARTKNEIDAVLKKCAEAAGMIICSGIERERSAEA